MSGLLEHLLSTPAWVVLLVVFALPALESSAFVGFLFPGETAVLLGGVAAGQHHVPLAAVAAAGVAGAVVGDATGYLVGRRWGPRILRSPLSRVVDERHLDRAEGALRRRGWWAVFVGRFTVALRVMVPGLAGMAGMPARRFLAANIAGGALWGVTMATIGYLAGRSWHRIEQDITWAGMGAIAALVAAVVVAHAVRRRRSSSDLHVRTPTVPS